MWSFHLAHLLANEGTEIIAVNPASFLVRKMVKDAYGMAQKLEVDSSVKVVVFQSAHPEIFVCHADTNLTWGRA